MDSHILFNRYLCTIPDAWITWPEKGKKEMQDFFYLYPDSQHSPGYFFNDLFDYIKEETTKNRVCEGLSASEWIYKYCHTVKGKETCKAHMVWHEPMLAWVSFNVNPLKTLMDDFFMYVISQEVLPCMMK